MSAVSAQVCGQALASTDSATSGQSANSLWFFSFLLCGIYTAGETSTAKTHTDGGAVIRKPGSAWLEGTPAISIIFMFYCMIVVSK